MAKKKTEEEKRALRENRAAIKAARLKADSPNENSPAMVGDAHDAINPDKGGEESSDTATPNLLKLGGMMRWHIRAGESKVLQQQVICDGELAWEDIPIHADNAVDGYCLACGSQEASKHVCPASQPAGDGGRYRCRCCVPCMAKCRRAEHGEMEG